MCRRCRQLGSAAGAAAELAAVRSLRSTAAAAEPPLRRMIGAAYAAGHSRIGLHGYRLLLEMAPADADARRAAIPNFNAAGFVGTHTRRHCRSATAPRKKAFVFRRRSNREGAGFVSNFGRRLCDGAQKVRRARAPGDAGRGRPCGWPWRACHAGAVGLRARHASAPCFWPASSAHSEWRPLSPPFSTVGGAAAEQRSAIDNCPVPQTLSSLDSSRSNSG